MVAWCYLANAIIKETRHPVWGELFKKLLAGALTSDDIEMACAVGTPRPDWVGIIAGGNPNYLSAVADIALTDFIGMAMEEVVVIESLEGTCAPEVFQIGKNMENERLN